MTSGRARVLIVEDTPSQAELARALLSGLGHELKLADTAGAALALAQSWEPDAILLDLELPDFSGFELMRRLRDQGSDAAIVVITANGSINTAVEAMREGAVDFAVKPFNKARLTVTLANCLEKRALAAQLRTARAQLDRDRFYGFIGASPAMRAVYKTIEAVASSRASVFITGESGTGKELAADAVHRASPRRTKGFIALNCGAIPRDLLESEIFGHTRGAFTGATENRVGAAKLADGGTLFLDEIGEMPLEMQVKLLRFVQTGTFSAVGSSHNEKVDVRFVCATNRDPQDEVREGRFREDLFYRLYVVPVELPPLRERGEDVLLIARHFLTQFAREENRGFKGFSTEAERMLAEYHWPGNVRQLQNVIRNVVVLHDAGVVTPDMLPRMLLRRPAGVPMPQAAAPIMVPAVPEPFVPVAVAPPVPAEFDQETELRSEPISRLPGPIPGEPDAATPSPGSADAAASRGVSLDGDDVAEIVPLAVMEKRLIQRALARTNNDVPRAAAMLQINPSTIYRKLQAWRADRGE